MQFKLNYFMGGETVAWSLHSSSSLWELLLKISPEPPANHFLCLLGPSFVLIPSKPSTGWSGEWGVGEWDDQEGFDLRSANPRADDGIESGGKCRALFRKRKAGARKGLCWVDNQWYSRQFPQQDFKHQGSSESVYSHSMVVSEDHGRQRAEDGCVAPQSFTHQRNSGWYYQLTVQRCGQAF